MSGTRIGGQKAAATNKKLHGEDFYRNIGRKGGKLSSGGGFAASYELAVEAGRKGGRISRRTKAEDRTIPCGYCSAMLSTVESRAAHCRRNHWEQYANEH